MFIRRFIVLLLSCPLIVHAGALFNSNTNYNFQNYPIFETQNINVTEQGVPTTQINTIQPNRIATKSYFSLLSSDVNKKKVSSTIFSKKSYSTSQKTVNRVSYNVFNTKNSATNTTETDLFSVPFLTSTQKLPVDPNDPGIIVPPTTPVGDNVHFLLILAFGFLLFRMKHK